MLVILRMWSSGDGDVDSADKAAVDWGESRTGFEKR
jgi:hypothetical protein